MGTIKYDCLNDYSEDNVEFFKELRGPYQEEWLTITYAFGGNKDIQQEYTIYIDKDDVIGLIEFLKQQFNLEE